MGFGNKSIAFRMRKHIQKRTWQLHGRDFLKLLGHGLECVPEGARFVPLLLLLGGVCHVGPVLRLVDRGQDRGDGVEGVLLSAGGGPVVARVLAAHDGPETLLQLRDEAL